MECEILLVSTKSTPFRKIKGTLLDVYTGLGIKP